jgi:L-galactono-1,4-lactone dehydrogenase
MLCSGSRRLVNSGVLRSALKKKFSPRQQSLVRRSLSSRPEATADGSQRSAVWVRAGAAAGLLLAGTSCGSLGYLSVQPSSLEASDENETTTLLNWSGTHAVSVPNDSYWEPETVEELEAIVRHCHERHKPVRPLGSALSPNGIGFHPGGMVSLTNLDKIVEVNKDAMTVTVQAGARVSQVSTIESTSRPAA